jgi:hypothetical protein
MIIAIDFDGTLHTGNWPDIGAPAPYAKEVMQSLEDDGHYLIIWTCREREHQTEMVNWLLEHGIPFDRINEHQPGSTEPYGYASRKVYADLYIDDKQVGGLPAWYDIYELLNGKENEYQQLKNK